jgi:primase-polymerase (primpol)-like protein
VKPETVNGDIGNLPRALLPLSELRNWVNWTWRPDKNGRWTKPPLRADQPDSLAANNKPETWSTYHGSVLNVLAGKADGIGFVLTGTEIGAIDLDKCRNPATGEIDTWAQEILNRGAHTYREVTVSGTGMRIIGIVTGARTHRKFTINGAGAGVEVYRRATRFITVSCKEVGCCSELYNIDALIDEIVAQQEAGASPRPHYLGRTDVGQRRPCCTSRGGGRPPNSCRLRPSNRRPRAN